MAQIFFPFSQEKVPQRKCVTKILPNFRVNLLVRCAAKPSFCWVMARDALNCCEAKRPTSYRDPEPGPPEPRKRNRKVLPGARTQIPCKMLIQKYLRPAFGRPDFSRIFIFEPPHFFADFLAGFFSHFCGKKCPEKSSRKIPGKSSKIYTTKILQHISADCPGQKILKAPQELEELSFRTFW